MKNMATNQTEKKKLLRWIDGVSFLVVELTEYLDTHPDDEEAMEYFRHYNQMRHQAMKEYAMKYEPLTLDTACPDKEFTWATSKWPWEGGDC